MPVKIDWLNIDVRDGEITAAESFKQGRCEGIWIGGGGGGVEGQIAE